MKCYLNAYRPLIATKAGLRASEFHQIPPFVDGSIRREPDIEHAFPSITCVCRGDKFAPRLQIGDIVVYMAVKRKYPGFSHSHYRLTAVLEVIEFFSSHSAAATWYRSQNLKLPSNCLVDGNPPLPIELSSKDPCDPDADEDEWDDRYQKRTAFNGSFAICRALYRELSTLAPVIEDNDLLQAFGNIPATRNPGALPFDDVEKFLLGLKVKVELPKPA